MTWISLVCLLALSSAVFSRSVPQFSDGYGGDSSFPSMPKVFPGMREQPIQRPFVPTFPQGYGSPQPDTSDFRPISGQDMLPQQSFQSPYGSSLLTPPLPKSLPLPNYGQASPSYGGSMSRILFDQPAPPQVPQLPMTPADLLCRGQQPETVIPIENNRKFVVCLDNGKGVEQECPRGLFYHETSRRCERKLGPLENVCVSQPCLNGGQCTPVDSSFQCQCAPGFDGQTCELDARICQTQQPCGQSPDVRCQSFRLGAALQYICIFQGGLAYGLNAQQTQQSPCGDVDGPRALAFTDKGFMMCDGERMFIESCPGGTIWDDLNKACVWPDMQARLLQTDQGYGQSSYGQQRTLINRPTYGEQTILPQPKVFPGYGGELTMIPRPKVFSGYGEQTIVPPQPKVFSGYGEQTILPRPKVFSGYGEQTFVPPQPKTFTGYGEQTIIPRPKAFTGYGEQTIVPPQPKSFSGYGEQTFVPPPQPKSFSGYGEQTIIPRPKVFSGYGEQTIVPPPQPKSFSGYGEQTIVPPPQPKSFSGYGEQTIVPPPQPKSFSGYGEQTIVPPQPKSFSGYGEQTIVPPQPKVFPPSSPY